MFVFPASAILLLHIQILPVVIIGPCTHIYTPTSKKQRQATHIKPKCMNKGVISPLYLHYTQSFGTSKTCFIKMFYLTFGCITIKQEKVFIASFTTHISDQILSPILNAPLYKDYQNSPLILFICATINLNKPFHNFSPSCIQYIFTSLWDIRL